MYLHSGTDLNIPRLELDRGSRGLVSRGRTCYVIELRTCLVHTEDRLVELYNPTGGESPGARVAGEQIQPGEEKHKEAEGCKGPSLSIPDN